MKVNHPSVNEKVFLITMNFLKGYNIEHVLAGQWGLSEETIWNKVKRVLPMIVKLAGAKIKWEQDENETFIGTIDSTHCPIFEVRANSSSKWYSHKFNGLGLAYEVVLSRTLTKPHASTRSWRSRKRFDKWRLTLSIRAETLQLNEASSSMQTTCIRVLVLSMIMT